MDVIDCNTCGNTGRWETTLEDAPTTLVDLGPCPDCNAAFPVNDWKYEVANDDTIRGYPEWVDAQREAANHAS